MKNKDMVSFAKLMMATGILYGKDCTEDLIELFFDDLRQFGFEDVKLAFRQYRLDSEHCSFFPKPGNIVKILSDNVKNRQLQLTNDFKSLVYASYKIAPSQRLEYFNEHPIALKNAVNNIGGIDHVLANFCGITGDKLLREFDYYAHETALHQLSADENNMRAIAGGLKNANNG